MAGNRSPLRSASSNPDHKIRPNAASSFSDICLSLAKGKMVLPRAAARSGEPGYQGQEDSFREVYPEMAVELLEGSLEGELRVKGELGRGELSEAQHARLR